MGPIKASKIGREFWKRIPGYGGRYEVSNLGKVRSMNLDNLRKFPTDLKQYLCSKKAPYFMVTLKKGAKGKSRSVHSLVLLTFIGPRLEKQVCRHLDGNPSNNRLYNLKWGTNKENAEDSVRHGTNHRGEKHHKSKLNEEMIVAIFDLYETGNWGPTRIGKLFGVKATAIWLVLNGVNWKNVAPSKKRVV